MVPGSCKSVFPKRLTGQRPANRKLDRERQQHDAARLSMHGGRQKSTLGYSENSRRIALEPLLALECRSRPTQSQQYLMSYIRHIYCRESNRRQTGLYDEMRA
jgi:hypothetical protein